jgi:hypothetical protein
MLHDDAYIGRRVVHVGIVAVYFFFVLSVYVCAVDLQPYEAQIGPHAGNTDAILLLEQVPTPATQHYTNPTSIEQTIDGDILAVWDGCTREANTDCELWGCRKTDSTWGEPFMIDNGVVNGNPVTVGCPILYQPKRPGAPLLLYYKMEGHDPSWKGYVRTSLDHGRTWSERIPLPVCSTMVDSGCEYYSNHWNRFVGPFVNQPLELPDGTLLASCENYRKNRLHVEYIPPDNYTGDNSGGAPWRFFVHSPQLKWGDQFIDVSPWGGSFLHYDRDMDTIVHVGRIGPVAAWSYDGGRSWSEHFTLLWPDDYSRTHGCQGLDAKTIDNGWHIVGMSHCHDRDAIEINACPPESSYTSWRWVLEIDHEQADMPDRERHDARLMQAQDRTLHLLYSGRANDLDKPPAPPIHVALDPEKLCGLPPAATHTITATVNDSTAGWTNPLGEMTVLEGGHKRITVTVHDGRQIQNVLVDGSSVGVTNDYTFEDVARDHTFEVIFTATDVYNRRGLQRPLQGHPSGRPVHVYDMQGRLLGTRRELLRGRSRLNRLHNRLVVMRYPDGSRYVKMISF